MGAKKKIVSKPAKQKAAGFTAEEKEAMKERVRELKSQARGARKEDGEAEVLAKIAEMPQPDRALATRLHALIKSAAPSLTSKTWYGMPAYAHDGDTICFFQSAHRFKARYATLGFSDKAKLDDGAMWPVAFALKEMTEAEEAKIRGLLKKALS